MNVELSPDALDDLDSHFDYAVVNWGIDVANKELNRIESFSIIWQPILT